MQSVFGSTDSFGRSVFPCSGARSARWQKWRGIDSYPARNKNRRGQHNFRAGMDDAENRKIAVPPSAHANGSSGSNAPDERIPLVPLGCLGPIVYLLLLMLDFFASLPSLGPPNNWAARFMDRLSVILLFPFSILFSTTYLPLLYHLLGCAFWAGMVCLIFFLFRRNR